MNPYPVDKRETESKYAPPEIVDLGTIQDLTKATGTTGNDGEGFSR
jgi:hypothetical protein